LSFSNASQNDFFAQILKASIRMRKKDEIKKSNLLNYAVGKRERQEKHESEGTFHIFALYLGKKGIKRVRNPQLPLILFSSTFIQAIDLSTMFYILKNCIHMYIQM
jgi:hypothetical protein